MPADQFGITWPSVFPVVGATPIASEDEAHSSTLNGHSPTNLPVLTPEPEPTEESPPKAAVYALVPRHSALPPEVADPASIKYMHEDLEKSGLKPEHVRAYPTHPVMGVVGAYVFVYKQPGKYRIKRDSKDNKYKQHEGDIALWIPEGQELETDATRIYLIEGEKKASKYKLEFPDQAVFGMGGCNTLMSKGQLIPEMEKLATPGRTFIAVFDADIETNRNVQFAARLLLHAVNARGCVLIICKPPEGKGVDDWLVADPHHQKVLLPYELPRLNDKANYALLAQFGCTFHNEKLSLNAHNVECVLRQHLEAELFRDRRRGLFLGQRPISYKELERDAIIFMQKYVNSEFKVSVIREGLNLLVHSNRDFVQDILRETKWDGVLRLDTWGSEYFESEIPKLANEWGRLLMTGFAFRLAHPGTKFDTIPILGGKQGVGKTTFMEDLSTFENIKLYYAITKVSDNSGDNNRTQITGLRSSAVVELAEGVVFHKQKDSIDLIKQFSTQTADAFREVYEREMVYVPRGFIITCTTNRKDLLSDLTGSRRFLPLWVTHIRKLSYETKLQILAEVIAKEEEICQTKWYDLQITLDDLPRDLKKGNEHIENPQEVINRAYGKTDSFANSLVDAVRANRLPMYIPTFQTACPIKSTRKGETLMAPYYFITTSILEVICGNNGQFNPSKMFGSLLSGLTESPTFEFYVYKTEEPGVVRPNARRFTGPKSTLALLDQDLQQLRGWWLCPKPGFDHNSKEDTVDGGDSLAGSGDAQ